MRLIDHVSKILHASWYEITNTKKMHFSGGYIICMQHQMFNLLGTPNHDHGFITDDVSHLILK